MWDIEKYPNLLLVIVHKSTRAPRQGDSRVSHLSTLVTQELCALFYVLSFKVPFRLGGLPNWAQVGSWAFLGRQGAPTLWRSYSVWGLSFLVASCGGGLRSLLLQGSSITSREKSFPLKYFRIKSICLSLPSHSQTREIIDEVGFLPKSLASTLQVSQR